MVRKLLALLLIPLFLFVFVTTVNAVVSTGVESSKNTTTGDAKTKTADPSIKLNEQMQLLQKQKNVEAIRAKEEAMAIARTKKEEFKTRIQTLKDQKKKILIEKIDRKLAKINQKQTTKFSEVLVRLQGFLDKIKQSATDAKVLSDIASAQTAIDTAKTALDIQTSKNYTIEIADETTLKINAGTVVSQLRQDLTAVHKLIVEAKQAVQKLNSDRELIKREATRRVPDGNPSTGSAK